MIELANFGIFFAELGLIKGIDRLTKLVTTYKGCGLFNDDEGGANGPADCTSSLSF